MPHGISYFFIFAGANPGLIVLPVETKLQIAHGLQLT